MGKTNILRGYAIGGLSKKTGVNIETIRYYERIGIMPDPARTKGGNRQYDHTQLMRLSFIRRCRNLGFSINELRTFLSMVDEDNLSCAQVHKTTLTHLQNIRKKLSDLHQLENALQAMAAQCTKGDIPNCPIIEALFENSQQISG